MFCRLKDFRRIATRYDKLATNFRDVIRLVAVVLIASPSLNQQVPCGLPRCVHFSVFMFEALIFAFGPYVLFSQQPGAPPRALFAPK